MSQQHEAYEDNEGLPVITDPGIDRVLKLARHYQQTVLDLNPNLSDEDLGVILNELDSQWSRVDEPARVSGKIKSYVIDVIDEYEDSDEEEGRSRGAVTTLARNDGEGEICTFNVNDQVCLSQGFTYEKEPLLVSGLPIYTRPVLKLLFDRQVVLANPTDVDDPYIVNVTCRSGIDDVICDFIKDSDELVAIKAREYFPDVVDYISENIRFKGTIADKIKALRMLEVECADYITYGDLNALSTYLDLHLKLSEEAMPFKTTFDEDAVFFDPDEPTDPIASAAEGSFLVTPIRVKFFPRIDTAFLENGSCMPKLVPGCLEVRMVFSINGPDQDQDTPEYEVRLRDIKKFKNIRQAHYGHTTISERYIELAEDEAEPAKEEQ